MMGDPAILGALAGLALGIVDFVVLGFVKARMAAERPSERLGASVAIEIARVSQLILFPLVGWFVGPALVG